MSSGTLALPVTSCVLLFSPVLFSLVRGFWRKEHRHAKPFTVTVSRKHGRDDTLTETEDPEAPEDLGRRNDATLRVVLKSLLLSPPPAVIWVTLLCSLTFCARLFVDTLGWKRHPKNLAGHLHDYLLLAVGGSTLLTLARGSRHLENLRKFILQVGFVLAAYMLVYQVSPNIKASVEPQGAAALVLIPLVLIVFVFVFAFHFLLAHHTMQPVQQVEYVSAFVAVLLIHGVLSMIPSIRVHMHHYYWGWLAAHFMVFDTEVSRLCQAYGIGISLHGVALFGVSPLFFPIDPGG
jgi:hypothetical protein